MDDLQVLEQTVYGALINYGLPEQKVKRITDQTVEKARRAKHSGPISRPGLLIDDRVASGRGILITIRKEYEDKYDPHEVLKEYVDQENYPGSWALEEAIGGLNKAVRVWKGSRTTSRRPSKSSKSKEKSIIKDFNKLSPEEQKRILSNLQK